MNFVAIVLGSVACVVVIVFVAVVIIEYTGLEDPIGSLADEEDEANPEARKGS